MAHAARARSPSRTPKAPRRKPEAELRGYPRVNGTSGPMRAQLWPGTLRLADEFASPQTMVGAMSITQEASGLRDRRVAQHVDDLSHLAEAATAARMGSDGGLLAIDEQILRRLSGLQLVGLAGRRRQCPTLTAVAALHRVHGARQSEIAIR